MRRLTLPLLLLIFSAACTPAATAVPAGDTPTAEPSLAVSPTPGPEADLLVDELAILPGEEEAQWLVVALLSNQGTEPLTAIEVEVSIFGADDALLGVQTQTLETRNLQPGDVLALLSNFAATAEVLHADIQLRAETAAVETATRLSPTILTMEAIHTPPDQHVVITTLQNDSDEAVYVEDFLLVARDAQGDIIAASAGYTGVHVLEPGEATLALTETPALPAGASFDSYLHATAWNEDAETPVIFLQDARLRFDEQGRPFITAYLLNEDTVSRWVEMVVTVRSDGAALALGHARIPAPLPPGESRGLFIHNLIPIQETIALNELGDLTTSLDVRIDPAGSLEADHYPRPLQVSLNYYERIGSVLIVRGTLTNTWAITLVNPSIMLALRSTEGTVLSGIWSVPAPSIGADQTLDFQLSLPLSAGLDPALSEYDLQAFGLLP